MGTKRTTELKALDLESLASEAKELKGQLKSMKFDHSVKGIQNPMEIRGTRKEIARIHTELRQRDIAAMSDEQVANRSKIRERRR